MNAPDSFLKLQFLEELEDKFEVPMVILSFFWLVLMIFELTVGLSPFLQSANNLIWGLFIVDFLLKLLLAPAKLLFLKRNWVLLFSLMLPALRLFRIFRALRILRTAHALRGLRMVRVLSSLNRGIRALGKSLGRRGFGYVLSLTLLIAFSGAAAMLSFEKHEGIISDYGTSLWWTAMILTTMGSDYFPRTAEGRFLCLLLAIYGFAVFGYVTATVATFFVGQDANDQNAEIAGQKSILELKDEIRALRREIQEMRSQP